MRLSSSLFVAMSRGVSALILTCGVAQESVRAVAQTGVAQTRVAQTRGVWLTTQDRRNLLKPQPPLHWDKSSVATAGSSIIVDDKQRFQPIDGFGHAIRAAPRS